MPSVARSIPPQSPLYNRFLLQFSRLFTFFNDEDLRKIPCAQSLDCSVKPNSIDRSPVSDLDSVEDEEIVKSVIHGIIPSYSLETKLGDCKRAAAVRREAVQRITGKSLTGLPLEGFDYNSIWGQCCEMPIGYVQIPVGIAGPLLLDGIEYSVPMATTEGCLVASTNRGCKAIHLSGGAFSVLLKDAMTRAPVVRFPSARRAALAMFYLQDPANFRDCLSCSINRVDLLGFRVSHARLLERISMRGFRVVLAMLWG